MGYGGVPFQEAKQVEVNTFKCQTVLQVRKTYMLVGTSLLLVVKPSESISEYQLKRCYDMCMKSFFKPWFDDNVTEFIDKSGANLHCLQFPSKLLQIL